MKLLLILGTVVTVTILVAAVEEMKTNDLPFQEFSAMQADNSTDDLEVRVTLLEDDVTDLQDEVEEMETDINQLDDGLLLVEGIAVENSNDIDDFESSVAETEDLISVLDDDVTELDVTVSTLKEENAQLQQTVIQLQLTVNLLLERVSALEATDSITNNTLDGINIQLDEVDERLDSVEDGMDGINDKITALEVENIDLMDRLTTVEEIIFEPWVACVSSPCDNGGTCIDVNVDTFVCMCRDGYFGITCIESYSDFPFLATFDTHPVTPSDPILFNYTVHNAGGHYDPTTGIYTVPLDGTYEIIFRIRSFEDVHVAAWLIVDGVEVTWTYERHEEHPYDGINMVIVLELEAGQQVWVKPYGMSAMSGTTIDGMNSWFSAHLVHAF